MSGDKIVTDDWVNCNSSKNLHPFFAKETKHSLWTYLLCNLIPPPPKETWEQRTSKVRYLEVIEYKSYGELWNRTIYLQNSFCIFYQSELNFTQKSYKKYNKFTISKLPEWSKPSKILDYFSLKEPTAGLCDKEFA